MRIIIADDSAIMREHLADALSGLENIEIIGSANSGSQALESIRKLKPDVAVLDIKMQSGSGIDVLEEIKQDADCPVVIMFTNYPFPQYRKKCEQAGADFFFEKSNESNLLIETLEDLAEKFREEESGSGGNDG
jgi:DNA-binding NarL/FixJ family response regulator